MLKCGEVQKGVVCCCVLWAPCRGQLEEWIRSGWHPGNIQRPLERGEALTYGKRLAWLLLVTKSHVLRLSEKPELLL